MPKTAHVIIGANFGDEGKGIISARCAQNAPGSCLSILTNGGAQRAHTVKTAGRSHVFQHFGSGSFFSPHSYFCKTFICNPMQFAMEYRELEAIGISPVCFRHPLCRWTTPYDMMANQILERCRGEARHGSCGMGIWNTVLRFDQKWGAAIPLNEFFAHSPEEQRQIVESVRNFYPIDFRLPQAALYRDVWFSEGLVEHFLCDLQFFYDHCKEADERELFLQYDQLIFENGQGLLLSSDAKNVHTTPSNTGCEIAISLLNQLDTSIDVTFHYVTRTYLTRHGAGALQNEQQRPSISSSIREDETNLYNEWQGGLRFAPLDLQDVTSRILNDYSKTEALQHQRRIVLDVTHLDELDLRSDLEALAQPSFDAITFRDRPDV